MLAEKYHCAILVIHHTRKSKSDDAFDEISGTTGLAGGVSGMFILSRIPGDENQSELIVRGRDIESDDKRLLTWNSIGAHHEVIGDPESFLLTKERAAVLEYLADGTHWRAQDIAEAIGRSKQSTHNLLHRLKGTGHVKQDASGKYFALKSVAAYVPKGYEAQPSPAPTAAEPVTPAEPLPRYTATQMIPENRIDQLRATLAVGNIREFDRMASMWLPTRSLIDTLREELSK
jgi:hypothetical protein